MSGGPGVASAAGGQVRVRPVRGRRDLRRFVQFPATVRRDDRNWVRPLRSEVLRRLDPQRNPFYATARRELFLAERAGSAVGTVAAIVDDARNAATGESVGYFGYFETIDDPEVTRALLHTAAGWLAGAGLTTMRGPINGSTSDETGVLVAGFDSRPALWQGHHPPHYRLRLEGLGLTTYDEVLAYQLSYDDIGRDLANLPAFLPRLAARARAGGATVRSTSDATWTADIAAAHRLYLHSHRTLRGHGGMSFEEFSSIANSMRIVLDPDLAILVELAGEPVGFAIAVPELNQALGRRRGHLPVWGSIRLLHDVRRLRTASVKLLGVLPEHRGRGLGPLLCDELIRRLVAKGYERCDLSLVSARNIDMTALAERLGARVYRRYRVFEAPLPWPD